MSPTQTTRVRGPAAAGLLLLALAALIGAPSLAAQTPSWVALDGEPAGTPAEVRTIASQTTSTRTTVEVIIHGYWRTDVLVPGEGVFARLDFPGLQRSAAPGAPELPYAPVRLGMSNDTPLVEFLTGQVVSQSVQGGVLVYPAPIPGEDEEFDPSWERGDGDVVGSPEVFTKNALIYGQPITWPPTHSIDVAPEPFLAGVPVANVPIRPVQWNAATNELTVITHGKYYFTHMGNGLASQAISRLTNKSLGASLLNWPAVSAAFPAFDEVFQARYLIIANVFWWDTLEPFAELKKKQGYEVSFDTAPTDVTGIKAVIADWYDDDAEVEQYVLLVGDIDRIPLEAVDKNGKTVSTDDGYGDVAGQGWFRDVHVGRLSVDNETDLGTQLGKIIAYQATPTPGADYHRALLVANHEDYPDKYTASMETVATQSYATPPTFAFAYGGTGATNTQVSNLVETGGFGADGLGLVAYRGHGSSRDWAAWAPVDEWYQANHVMQLNNPVHPVVWSISCTNADLYWTDDDLTDPDCLSEVWMEVPQGAAASYAATRSTTTVPNHLLNEQLFKRVYDDGITTHALAIEAAEGDVWASYPGHHNPWAYLLLGDPSMTIRREEVSEITIQDLPISLNLDDEDDEMLVRAVAWHGDQPPEAIASLYKASFLNNQPDETLGAYWLEGGEVWADLALQTPGTLFVTVRDVNGNQSTVEVPVEMGAAWTDAGHALPGAEFAPQLAGLGVLEGGSSFSVLGTDLRPGETIYLALGLAVADVPLKGGVLVPDLATPPARVLTLPADADGNLILSGIWPLGVPSGFEVVLQAWQADASGPVGFIASNGLVATAP